MPAKRTHHPASEKRRPPTIAEVTRAADLQDERHRSANARQVERLTSHMAFLQARGLVDDFNAWEAEQREQPEGK